MAEYGFHAETHLFFVKFWKKCRLNHVNPLRNGWDIEKFGKTKVGTPYFKSSVQWRENSRTPYHTATSWKGPDTAVDFGKALLLCLESHVTAADEARRVVRSLGRRSLGHNQHLSGTWCPLAHRSTWVCLWGHPVKCGNQILINLGLVWVISDNKRWLPAIQKILLKGIWRHQL